MVSYLPWLERFSVRGSERVDLTMEDPTYTFKQMITHDDEDCILTRIANCINIQPHPLLYPPTCPFSWSVSCLTYTLGPHETWSTSAGLLHRLLSDIYRLFHSVASLSVRSNSYKLFIRYCVIFKEFSKV